MSVPSCGGESRKRACLENQKVHGVISPILRALA